jgi:hypothetical protein
MGQQEALFSTFGQATPSPSTHQSQWTKGSLSACPPVLVAAVLLKVISVIDKDMQVGSVELDDHLTQYFASFCHCCLLIGSAPGHDEVKLGLCLRQEIVCAGVAKVEHEELEHHIHYLCSVHGVIC